MTNRSWPDGTHTDLTWHAENGQIMAGKLFVGSMEPEDARHVVALKEGKPTQSFETYDPWELRHDDHIVQDDVYVGIIELRADAELVVKLHNKWLASKPVVGGADETPAP